MGAEGPRWLYLHGFGSGPDSTKGVAVEAHYARYKVKVERLDMRRPSLEGLRLSAMMQHVRAKIGGPQDRAVLWGSSLGGLTAARVAEEDPRVCALVLLAPAFKMIERWRAQVGTATWQRWQDQGALEVDDYVHKTKAKVDFGFAVDAEAIDARGGGWPDVRVPTLIIHGKRDDVVDPKLSRRFADERRWVKLVEVDDGHQMVASVAKILDAADRFLDPILGG